jgi:hypothetical protein
LRSKNGGQGCFVGYVYSVICKNVACVVRSLSDFEQQNFFGGSFRSFRFSL